MESLREQAIFQSPLDLIVLFQICISWSAPHPAPRGHFGSVWFPPSLPRTLAPPPPALAEHGHRGYRAGTCFACCHLPKLPGRSLPGQCSVCWTRTPTAAAALSVPCPGEVRLFSSFCSCCFRPCWARSEGARRSQRRAAHATLNPEQLNSGDNICFSQR